MSAKLIHKRRMAQCGADNLSARLLRMPEGDQSVTDLRFENDEAGEGQWPGNKPAHGNALGLVQRRIKALKGRNICAALSGLFRIGLWSVFDFADRALKDERKSHVRTKQ